MHDWRGEVSGLFIIKRLATMSISISVSVSVSVCVCVCVLLLLFFVFLFACLSRPSFSLPSLPPLVFTHACCVDQSGTSAQRRARLRCPRRPPQPYGFPAEYPYPLSRCWCCCCCCWCLPRCWVCSGKRVREKEMERDEEREGRMDGWRNGCMEEWMHGGVSVIRT
jgi:hypothetical protein